MKCKDCKRDGLWDLFDGLCQDCLRARIALSGQYRSLAANRRKLISDLEDKVLDLEDGLAGQYDPGRRQVKVEKSIRDRDLEITRLKNKYDTLDRTLEARDDEITVLEEQIAKDLEARIKSLKIKLDKVKNHEV